MFSRGEVGFLSSRIFVLLDVVEIYFLLVLDRFHLAGGSRVGVLFSILVFLAKYLRVSDRLLTVGPEK